MIRTVAPCRLRGTVAAPPNKSHAQRLLICAAFGDRPCLVRNIGKSEDIAAVCRCLEALGARLIPRPDDAMLVIPAETTPAPANCDCGESGACLRFLLPVAMTQKDSVLFLGSPGLSRRPLAPLLRAMSAHGVSFSYDDNSTLPLLATGSLEAGDHEISPEVSSQFVSGLLLALPLLTADSRLLLTGQAVSAPYIRQTLEVLRTFGADITDIENGWRIRGKGRYHSPEAVSVEGDWSGAAFFLAAGALGNEITVTGLDLRSRQGDKSLLPLLEQAGARITCNDHSVTVSGGSLRSFQADLIDTPDLLPVLALLAAAAEGESRLTGISRLSGKESDRPAEMTKLINSFGAKAFTEGDALFIRGGKLRGFSGDLPADHRVVMAAAILATAAAEPCLINNSEAIKKSFPDFWEKLSYLTGKEDPMTSQIGKNFKVTVFGASHQPQVGCIIEGLPAGITIDLSRLQRFLDRRKPGQHPFTSARQEADIPCFTHGLTDGVTDGGALRAVIANTDRRSRDYAALKHTPRPGHADYPAAVRFGEAVDMSGGGPFSGRMTAPMCVAGGIALQLLAAKGVTVAAHLAAVGDIHDRGFSLLPKEEELKALTEKSFPVLDDKAGEKMIEAIMNAAAERDSLGGVIEIAALNMPVGAGGAMFDGAESRLSAALFGIPAVKAVEFGSGFAAAAQKGSENNDPFLMDKGRIRTATNNCGGLLGGMTNGMPVIIRVAVKPTPSIAKPQRTVDLAQGGEREIRIEGRHDPCIAPRAVAAAEAVTAITLLDMLMEMEEWI